MGTERHWGIVLKDEPEFCRQKEARRLGKTGSKVRGVAVGEAEGGTGCKGEGFGCPA